MLHMKLYLLIKDRKKKSFENVHFYCVQFSVSKEMGDERHFCGRELERNESSSYKNKANLKTFSPTILGCLYPSEVPVLFDKLSFNN